MIDYFTSPEDVLENKLGISNADELKKAEAQFCYIRQIEIEAESLPKAFDFDFLLLLHNRLFNDLYDFAGKVRTVDITKGSIPFCYTQNIEAERQRIFTELKHEHYLQGLGKDQIAERLAYYSSELNALHPFREGNGRTIRLYLGLLAQYAGYKILYHESEDKDLLLADIAGFNGDLNPLINLYKRIISARE